MERILLMLVLEKMILKKTKRYPYSDPFVCGSFILHPLDMNQGELPFTAVESDKGNPIQISEEKEESVNESRSFLDIVSCRRFGDLLRSN